VKKTFVACVAGVVLSAGAWADEDHARHFEFKPDTLVLSRSVYVGTPDLLVPGVTLLPPGCVAGTVDVPLIAGGTTPVAVTCSTPTADGTFPNIFTNGAADAHFGITSPIFLDNLTTDGHLLSTLAIPTDRIVTSFSSKSEMALNRSIDGKSITFMGYRGGPGFKTAVNVFDVSNANTPGVIDPTNAAVGQYYRSVAEVDALGHLQTTDSNAYSGDNGRAAIKGNSLYYMVGNDNSGNLSKKQVTTTIAGEELVNSNGVELLVPGQAPPVPPNINKIGDFEINQVIEPSTGVPYALDKAGKDDNFRGVTIFHHTLYVTKAMPELCPAAIRRLWRRCRSPSCRDFPIPSPPVSHLPARRHRSPFRSEFGSPTKTRCTSAMRAMERWSVPRSTGMWPTLPASLLPACRSGSA